MWCIQLQDLYMYEFKFLKNVIHSRIHIANLYKEYNLSFPEFFPVKSQNVSDATLQKVNLMQRKIKS